jgi:hypothetical protein
VIGTTWTGSSTSASLATYRNSLPSIVCNRCRAALRPRLHAPRNYLISKGYFGAFKD